MSNLIEFLEQMGRDSQSRFATGPELEAALTSAGIEPAVRAAILAGNQLLLESLLGARRNVCSLINVPEEEEESEEENEEEDDEEEEDKEHKDVGAVKV
jgi:hypothetical protein